MSTEINTQELLKHFQRDINCLAEEDRNLKKKGLLSISNDFFNHTKDEIAILNVYQHHIIKYLLKLIDDKIEKHRELVLQIHEKFINIASRNQSLIDKDTIEILLRSIISRLNTLPFLETSEELRLFILQLLKKFVETIPNLFIHILSDYSNMLIKIVNDSCPDSKKESALLIISSAANLKEQMGYHANSILKSLIINLNHQHSKIRKSTIEAISSLILTDGACKSVEIIYPSLKLIMNDKIIDVRKTVIESVAKMINGLSLSNLKESEGKLIYLLLNGLSDENEDIVGITLKLLEDVGIKRKLLAVEYGENIDLA